MKYKRDMAQNKHTQFMQLALGQAKKAFAAGEFPVGCVFVAHDEVVATGHRQNSAGVELNEVDHAEVVTLRQLLLSRPGFDCSEITLYSTMEPCLMCYTTMLLSGIRRFVWGYEDIMGGGTKLNLTGLAPLYAQMDVDLLPDVLRAECLQLFKDFFQQYSYWRGSMLERYTLKQK